MNVDYYDIMTLNAGQLRDQLATTRMDDGAPVGALALIERVLDHVTALEEQVVGLTNLVAGMQRRDTEPLPCATCNAPARIEFGSNKLGDTSIIQCTACTDRVEAISLKQAIETWNRR